MIGKVYLDRGLIGRRLIGRHLIALGLAVFALAAPPALATPLLAPAGGSTDYALPGMTAAGDPTLVGLVLADTVTPYAFGADARGSVQSRVVRSTLLGTLDFYWRIVPDPLAAGGVIAFRISGFGASPPYDGDYRPDGLGQVPAATARVFGPASSGFVNFLFGTAVQGAAESTFFYLRTAATAYGDQGSFDLLCAPLGCVSGGLATYAPAAPVPAPAAISLAWMMAAGLATARRRITRPAPGSGTRQAGSRAAQ